MATIDLGKVVGGVDLLTVYPVGSIYTSANETSPASLFGGTWEQLPDEEPMEIQYGELSSRDVSASGYCDTSVTFAKAFTANPFVTVCLVSSSESSAYGSITCAVKLNSISTNGFTIRAYNNSSSTRQPDFAWMAVSKGAAKRVWKRIS